MKLHKKLLKVGASVFNALAQTEAHHNPEKTVTPGMPECLRSVAAQTAVLLENRVLPLNTGTRISVFGRTQIDWFATGYGSGGDVNTPYIVNLLEGLRDCEALSVNEGTATAYERWCVENPANHGVWGKWPRSHPEMPVTAEFVHSARQHSDQAVIVLGRSSGEDRENVPEPGSFYLTEAEKDMLRQVTTQFPDAILLLNIGAIMDLSFLKDYSFGAVMILWQGGMESGNAAADLLCGKAVPSGRLTDTIAANLRDYPSTSHFGRKDANEYFEDIYVGYRWFETFGKEKVLYPFGYGLSYTTFQTDIQGEDPLIYHATVTNTGKHPGRHTLMLFVEKPCGVLGNPARELVAFAKTRLLAPGEQQTLTLECAPYEISSYDDSGLTGNKSCYVLQKGPYRFYLGDNVRNAEHVGTLNLEEEMILARLTETAAPRMPFPILFNDNGIAGTRKASFRTADLKPVILGNLPEPLFITGDRGLKLKDVKEGRASMDAFVAQLSDEELEAISRGGYIMGHPLGAKGNAGIFGGVTESLRKKGIPVVTTTDGPSGIRLYDSCSLIPIGTALASTFDTALVEELCAALGQEMRDRGSDVLLAPGMNIHRNPLCGRNFEYFSEDPLLTGRMAAAFVRGIQSAGLAACPKHFACNNQETNRNKTDSILSERALREIYLKGFEICVREAKPKTIMTSYNKINGVWGHYHYELVKTILRDEWGFDGCVLTDWWMQYASSPDFPNLKGNAYRVRSQVDVLMPGSRSFLNRRKKPDGTLLATYKKEDGITLGEMQLVAKHVLHCIMELKDL
ncbi:MAG: glycoside hydrolase family 3 C-terminal domain-containing protein [Oscillospiraceae bacterium]|nr:glycoside hydrolase family 3 C-terminal domain-containing protein [Oscillospiraceae bacterium]